MVTEDAVAVAGVVGAGMTVLGKADIKLNRQITTESVGMTARWLEEGQAWLLEINRSIELGLGMENTCTCEAILDPESNKRVTE